MNKIYNQKENINLYIFFIILFVALYIWAVWLVNYHLYLLFLPLIVLLIKVIKIKKNPEEPVIKPTDTEIHFLITGKTFKYSEIKHIHLNSKWTNGHLLLKATNKKEIINSVAISLDNQNEIRVFVLNKINSY